MSIRVRDDGFLGGVNGPVFPYVIDRKTVAERMGWADSGKAARVITQTIELLAQGKAVRLTSYLGWCCFQPLRDEEDGTKIPASAATTYDAEGEVIERVISASV